MSNPSYSNIDRWLFELTEGNLSPEQISQLEAFLMQHPELDVDRDMWELAKVDSEEVIYPHQQKIVRRRPVGLYMSLGFASIAVFISLGIFNFMNYAADSTLFASQITRTSELDNFDGAEKLAINKRSSTLSETNNNSNTLLGFDTNDSKLSQNDFSATENEQSGFKNIIKQSNGIKENSKNQSLFAHQELNSKNKSGNLLGFNTLSESLLTNEENLDELETNEAEQIDVNRPSNAIIFRSTNNYGGTRFTKSDYKVPFSSKMSNMARSLQRMLDNPVALKNMKDPYYHVPGMQAMDVNFGAVGTLLATRVQTVSRAQWLGQENQHLMNQLSIDGYSYGMRGGLGFQFNHNYYGKGGIENYHAALIYSPKFSVARNINVEPSVRFKMGSKLLKSDQIEIGSEIEYDRMNTQSFYTNGEAPIGSNLWYKDLGLGLMVNTKWFYVGIQGDNLFEHYDNIYSNDITNPKRAGKHFVATIGTDYESKKENITVSPYCVYQQQEALSEGWLGVNLRYEWLTIGGAVSSKFEPAASIGMKFDHFMLTYNADLTHSQLLNKEILSHQVTIRFLSKPSRIGQRLLNQ